MPGFKFTKLASTHKRNRQWEHVYSSVKAKGGSGKSAVIQANGVLKKEYGKGSRKG